VSLWRARNDKLVRWFGDSTNDSRRAWVAIQRERGNDGDFLVSRFAERSEISVVRAGDTGQGDGSQYAVVPGLQRRCDDTDSMFICSDEEK
jgi:hypothetical protein